MYDNSSVRASNYVFLLLLLRLMQHLPFTLPICMCGCVFILCLLIRYRFDVGVTSLFVGKCVRENELEKLKGVAMAASNKLFNLSFLATKPVYFFVLFCFGFVIFFCVF